MLSSQIFASRSTQEGECLATLTKHSDSVTALIVLRDGRLVSGSKDGNINFWDTETGQHLLLSESL